MHPLGQTLIVAWPDFLNRAAPSLRPSDVIWFPPGEKQTKRLTAVRHGARQLFHGCSAH
jgi:hypothetical protein